MGHRSEVVTRLVKDDVQIVECIMVCVEVDATFSDRSM